MEVLLVLLVVVAVPVVLIAARRGAEAAQVQRERRWSELPAQPSPAGRERRWAELAADPSATRRPAALRSATTAAARGEGAATAAPDLQQRPGGPSVEPTAAPEPQRRQPSQPAAEPSGPTDAARPAPPPVDVNTAPVEELRKLPGVGVRAAERIVAHRERHGEFASVADLEAVEGFDHHRVSRLAPRAKA